MRTPVLTYIMLTVCLILVQVLVCSHIMLFSVALPIVFFYPILRLPMSLPVKGVMTYAFLLGLIVDIFSDTPGVNAISCTILSVIRRPVFKAFIGNDEVLSVVAPSIGTVGFWTIFKYLLVCTPIYCFLAIMLEYYTFVQIGRTLSIIGASSLFSFILILAIDSLTGSKRQK